MKASREVREGSESEKAVGGLLSQVRMEEEQVDKMVSVGSVREPRWMFGEQDVGSEMDGC